MALAFGTQGPSGTAGLGLTQLEEIQTEVNNTSPSSAAPLTGLEALGFHAIAGDAKVQLLPAWPSDKLPPPTSSLLAIASKRGLLAAGGPSSVVVASTESVREAFKAAGDDIKPFSPQLTLELNTRISQVAFSSDESLLAISAEHGGGLAVYDVASLMQGHKQSTFEMPTGGVSIRALLPNPARDAAHLFAIITTNGQLMIANMKTQQFASGVNGQVLKDGVSCACWSNKGKAIVAGLGNGGLVQLQADGKPMAEIPKPPALQGDQHVSAISWIETFVFLVAHTPSGPAEGLDAASTYHIIMREKATGRCDFQKLPDICSPFGLSRVPASQFMQRLGEFPPNLQDTIIITSTAADDVGLVTRSSKPLASDVDPAKITNRFTLTTMANDSRRAQLPFVGDVTSPVGMALDLSSKTNVHRPLPGEELDESPGPLPALMILTNVGILAAWWIAYADSIRSGGHYPGLAMYDGEQQQQQGQTQQQTQASAPSFGTPSSFAKPSFGQSSFGNLSGTGTATPTLGFQKPTGPSFGSSSALGLGPSKPVFGSSSTLGGSGATFGSPSPMGAAAPANPGGSSKPVFGSASTLGGSGTTFGSPSPMGAAAPTSSSTGGQGGSASVFGASSGLGQRSPWGASPQTGGSSFGKPSFGNASGLGPQSSPWAPASQGGTAFGKPSMPASQSSPFGGSSSGTNATSGATSGGGFASFASSGGFAAAAKPGGASVFAQPTSNKSFTSDMDTESAFTPKKDAPSSSTGVLGSGNSGFTLGSAWKNENAGKDEPAKPAAQGTSNLFGSDFGKMLGETSKQLSAPQSNETDMSDEMSDAEPEKASDSPKSPAPPARETTTPAETPAASKFLAPSGSGLFGMPSQSQKAPATAQGSQPMPRSTLTPVIKEEPGDDSQQPASQPPLPPEATSKAAFTPTTSSAASTESTSKAGADDAPKPADFFKPKAKPPSPPAAEEPEPAPSNCFKQATKPPAAVEDAPLPPDFFKPKPKAAVPQTPTEAPPNFLAPEAKKSNKDLPEESQALPEDDDDLDDGLDDEGSGVDVSEEIDEPSPKITPESSFGKHDGSLVGGPFTNIKQPQAQSVQTRSSLFGEIGKSSMPVFPPPSKLQESPRSPSPVRSAVPGDLLRTENLRSVSAPNVPTAGRAPLRRSMIQTAKPVVSFEQRQREEQERLAREKQRQQEEEEQSLSDREDELIRQELESEIQASTELEGFIAHQDYVGAMTKAGIPGQIEKVYRDINSMLDTLGLNSRNLQAFTKGHEEMFKQSGRTKEDLDNEKDWVLVEIEDLSTIETTLESELEAGRLHDVEGKVHAIRDMRKELAKLRARQSDIKRTIEARIEAESIDAYRAVPLSAEQSVQRNELRKQFAEFQKQLAQAEEAISMLRAKLATVSLAAGTKKGAAPKVPTVEAVENTIRKMTSMVEKKSGDLDFLETQMRKLNMRPGSVSDSPFSSRAPSREGSPFVTPPPSAHKKRLSVFAPGSSLNGSPLKNGWGTPRSSGLGASITSLAASDGGRGLRRKKLTEYSSDDVKGYARRAARKREVMGLLRDAIVGKDDDKEVKVRQLR